MISLCGVFAGRTCKFAGSTVPRFKLCLCKPDSYGNVLDKTYECATLTLVLLNHDIPCLYKQNRSRSVGLWRSQLIWICTVCHSVCGLTSTIWIKESDWLTIRSGRGILIYVAWQGSIVLKLSTLDKFFSNDKLKYFFLIFPKNRIWHFMQIVCNPMEEICMTGQILYSWKNWRHLAWHFKSCFAGVKYHQFFVCPENDQG